MREILFRGKTKEGEWVQGDYTKGFRHPDEAKLEDMIYMFSGEPGKWQFDYASVIPETVGQYTGLTDKNGTKIFEGDIVEVKGHIPTVNGLYEVIYAEVNHCYALSRSHGFHHHYFSFSELNGFHEDCEVIGNIHDNPELMEAVQG